MLSTRLLQDVHTLAQCSHEEADSRMLLHISHPAQHDHHHQMLIRTVDTNAVVLAVFAINHLPAGWLALGTGKSLRYLANGCESWTRDVMCPTNVQSFDRLTHCMQLWWIWKEISTCTKIDRVRMKSTRVVTYVGRQCY